MDQSTRDINVNEAHEESLSKLEKFALFITEHVGSISFFALVTFWTFSWMGWNCFAQYMGWSLVFDKPWEFGIWLFFSNLLQLHLMPLIMLGQNLQARHAEIKADAEHELAKMTEQETEHIIEQLRILNEKIDGLTKNH